MKVCVVGGGHIGTTLTCYIKHRRPEFDVRLYTQHPERFSEVIKCNDVEHKTSFYTTPDIISKVPESAAKDADIVFIALPHFAVEKAFADIAPYVAEYALIGVLPGGGGCEFFFHKYFDEKKTLFGFQRVPFTAKVAEYGKETNLKSWKPYSVVGTLFRNRIDHVCEMIEQCGLKTRKASNYLEIALTPTNPILHTSRTYEIFGKYPFGHKFEEKLKFYVGWTEEASKTLFGMDAELHQLLDQMTEIDTSAIRPLAEHYESPTIEAMTKKINSITTFQSVYAPLNEENGAYYADVSSRMFTEDFPWGLVVIRSYFEPFGVSAPTIDRVLSWYADYFRLEWFVDGKFCGKDLAHTGAIQNYGIFSRRELIGFYMQ